MKSNIVFMFTLMVFTSFSALNAQVPAPVETTKPNTWWPWIIGVLVAIALGMLLYRMLKKDPKKDVTR